MTVTRRVAAVEGSLDPLAIVLKVIAEAQEHPGLEAYARAIAEVAVEAAPLSRIGAEVEAGVRSSLKGRPRDEVDRAVRRAVGDAVFRYILFLRLNTSALEIADHEGLRAAAVFYWMGCLLSEPREADLEPAEWQEHRRQQAECWQTWRSVVASLLVKVMVEEEAREALEARYLGGRPAWLAKTEEAWDRFAGQVDRLWSIAGAASEAGDPEDDPEADPLTGRVADRARHLADDARISAFERLGEMPRAVAIVEARLASIGLQLMEGGR
jgi:hypothetical protein